jgi:spermidine synthase
VARSIAATAALGVGLLASGASALINQVVWQAALKRYLGGSEALSSMVVVLVFMGGLGLGSLVAGRLVPRLGQPLAVLGGLELVLGAVNLMIRFLVTVDPSVSIFRAQALGVSLGIPLLALYAGGAVLVLGVPCTLMGATLPVASEACQRQLGARDSRVLGLLFAVNTLGSVAGALVASGSLIPQHGYRASMLFAAGLSLASGAVLFCAALVVKPLPAQRATTESPGGRVGPTAPVGPVSAGWLALGLGFCSLAYEMHLFRALALRHEPLPFTFAAVITGFLLYWSVGAALASRLAVPMGAVLGLCTLSVGASLVAFMVDTPQRISGTLGLAGFVLGRSSYLLPCLFFGYLFSGVLSTAKRSWGGDVGRICALNTVGCCLGIVGMTFVGYDLPVAWVPLVLAFLVSLLAATLRPLPRWALGGWSHLVGGALLVVALGLTRPVAGLGSQAMGEPPMAYALFGRNGVIGVDLVGNMFWDGLWHSKLSVAESHIGGNNWDLAVFPVLTHGPQDIRHVCVVGMGTGITAGTLARLGSVASVDVYEMNDRLQSLMEHYPDGTLRVLTNPKVRILWQDVRSGFSLRAEQYDIVVSQPMYLRQAGSSILNSVEFYRLVGSRLKRGGVFCLYCPGTPAQGLAVRQTAAQAFRYGESFLGGYLLILSNDPLDLSKVALAERFRRGSRDALWGEIRAQEKTRDAEAVLRTWDHPRPQWGGESLVITDDWPILEYPEALARRVRQGEEG